MFQLDDSKSLYRKWLFHQTSIYKWLFGVPGTYISRRKNTATVSRVKHTNPNQHNLGSPFVREGWLFTLSFCWAKHLENIGIPTTFFPNEGALSWFFGRGPNQVDGNSQNPNAGPPRWGRSRLPKLELTAKGN